MSTSLDHPNHQKLTYTARTGDGLPSLSGQPPLLTGSDQPSPSSPPPEAVTAPYIQTINQPLKRTLNASGNDPQLLAEIFKPTVEAMIALDMLTLAKTDGGRLVIILPTNLFNDDLTLKGFASLEEG
jgi:hypothetical protein